MTGICLDITPREEHDCPASFMVLLEERVLASALWWPFQVVTLQGGASTGERSGHKATTASARSSERIVRVTSGFSPLEEVLAALHPCSFSFEGELLKRGAFSQKE